MQLGKMAINWLTWTRLGFIMITISFVVDNFVDSLVSILFFAGLALHSQDQLPFDEKWVNIDWISLTFRK